MGKWAPQLPQLMAERQPSEFRRIAAVVEDLSGVLK
jgi:hypothetical protein